MSKIVEHQAMKPRAQSNSLFIGLGVMTIRSLTTTDRDRLLVAARMSSRTELERLSEWPTWNVDPGQASRSAPRLTCQF